MGSNRYTGRGWDYLLRNYNGHMCCFVVLCHTEKSKLFTLADQVSVHPAHSYPLKISRLFR